MPVYKAVNKKFFKKWTSEMAYALGFFAADGYITHNKRGANFWCIEITDKDLLENIKVAVGSEHALSARPRGKSEKTIYRLQIGSKEMCDDLRRLGFSERKTKSLAVPHVPRRYFSHFVRGYFDGDGNVWTGYVHRERTTGLLVIRTVFTSCSRDFLEVLKARLKIVGVNSGVLAKGKGNYYRLTYSIYGSLELYGFMYNHNEPAPEGLFLERKKKVFDAYIKLRP